MKTQYFFFTQASGLNGQMCIYTVTYGNILSLYIYIFFPGIEVLQFDLIGGYGSKSGLQIPVILIGHPRDQLSVVVFSITHTDLGFLKSFSFSSANLIREKSSSYDVSMLT